jgi:hypothetical protein
VFPADVSRGWRVVRQVTATHAFEKVTLGKWREVFDDGGNFLGCQVLATFRTDQDLPSGASSTSITWREAMLYAGLGGESRTIGMNEDQRITRQNLVSRSLPPEDRIERVMAKVECWPYPASRIDDGRGAPVFGDRAIRIYPRE